MVALILYAYAKGVRSAREIERRCVEDVAFRVVAGNLAPDHATIARFRAEPPGRAGCPVRLRCWVSVSALGTGSRRRRGGRTRPSGGERVRAYEHEPLSRSHARSSSRRPRIDAAEDALYGDKRGDELPDDLADPKTRRARLRELMGRAQSRKNRPSSKAREEMLERRAEHERQNRPASRAGARRSSSLERPEKRSGGVNVTDPDSRPVKTPRGFIQGYNAHNFAADSLIIVAANVSDRHTGPRLCWMPMVHWAAGSASSTPPAPTGPDYGPRGRRLLAKPRHPNSSPTMAYSVLVPPDAHTSHRTTARQTRRPLSTHARDRLVDPGRPPRYIAVG